MFREERVEMQRIDEYRFYELGQKLHGLHDIKDDTLYSDVWYPMWEARAALEKLKSDVLSLRFSMPVVDRLITAITAVIPEDLKEAVQKAGPPEGAAPLSISWHYYELQQALSQFEPVLATECKALDTYVVSQKRGYSTSDLVDRAES